MLRDHVLRQRDEVSGLRAFAVLPVVINHAFPAAIPGGFAGVDVFFVISGYLITQILMRDLSAGTFSIARFYERRIRRILPMLMVVSIATVAMAWTLLFFGSDFGDLLVSVGAAALFISNFYFAQEIDYFSSDAALLPMLHTWSLAVEEQFYLVFPLAFVALWKFERRSGRGVLWLTLAVAAVASFCLALWGSRSFPEVNFFYSWARGWELLAGALAAGSQDMLRRRFLRFGGGITGLGLGGLLATYFLVPATVQVPSEWTVAPVVCTAMILVFGEEASLAARLLRWRVFVLVGLSSYSFYLLHQPILAFTRIYWPQPTTLQLLSGVLAAMFLSVATWRWIEQPLRHAVVPQRVVLRTAVVTVLAVASVCGIVSKIRPDTLAMLSLPQDKLGVARFMESRPLIRTKLYGRGKCFVGAAFPDPQACSTVRSHRGSVLVWGDSHAAALAVGLLSRIDDLAVFTTFDCAVFVSDRVKPGCAEAFAQTVDAVGSIRPETVVLHANWLLRRAELDDLPALIERIGTISPRTRVVIVGGVPQWAADLPLLLLRQDETLGVGMRLGADLAEIEESDALLSKIAQAAGAGFVPLLGEVCDAQSACIAVVKNAAGEMEPFAFDYGHMTGGGSDLVATALVARLASMP